MSEERLLERIGAWKREPHRRVREDPRRAIDSVLNHLQRILNTKQGNVPIAEDYGLPDFTDFSVSYSESVREMERAIRQVIQKYEPRLTGVRVGFLPQENDLLSLRFQITARLVTDQRKVPVLFQTVVGSDGKISVST